MFFLITDLYLKLEDVTHKFNKPCIMDVKIGRKSYDPFASSEKIQQQVSKYPLMEEIGFLVLGMRVRVIISVIYTFSLCVLPLKIMNAILISEGNSPVCKLCKDRDFLFFVSC
jgi:hypothetical protein